MAILGEREKTGVVVAEPKTPLPTPVLKGKPRGRWTVGRIARIGQWASAGLAAIGLYQSGIVPTTIDALSEFSRTREGNIAARMARESRSLGPLPGEQASWWMELPEERIRELAQLPEINQIGDRYVSTVSPALQERAKQAGYKLIYQGDTEDTVGRTVITKGREVILHDYDWSVEDLGFGRASTKVKAVFRAWVPDPDDSYQKNKVYALLEDPVKKRQFVVAIDLYPYDPNRNTNVELPTFFAVDNLDYGPSYISEKIETADKQSLSGFQMPDPEDPPSKKWKGIIRDFPELHKYLRGDGYDLSDIARPGDYVVVTLGVRSAPPVKFWDDEKGVVRGKTFIVRRFDGFQQWQSEVGKR